MDEKIEEKIVDMFPAACAEMERQFGRDVLITLATRTETGVDARVVDGYYKDGCIYIVSHLFSHKVREISRDPAVAVCRDLMNAQGTAENLGSPTATGNAALWEELRNVFAYFAGGLISEGDAGACILKITLTSAVVCGPDTKYIVDFEKQAASALPFTDNYIRPE